MRNIPIPTDVLIFDYTDLGDWPKAGGNRFPKELKQKIAYLFDETSILRYMIKYKGRNVSNLSTEQSMEEFFQFLFSPMTPFYFRSLAMVLDGRDFTQKWANFRQNEALVEYVVECFIDSMKNVLKPRVKPYALERLEENIIRLRNHLLYKCLL